MKLKNIFKKEPKNLIYLPKDKNDVRIYQINDSTVILYESLGITENRAEEISKMLDSYVNNCKDIFNTIDCIKTISQDLIHPNELFYASYYIGRYCESQSSALDLINKLRKYEG